MNTKAKIKLLIASFIVGLVFAFNSPSILSLLLFTVIWGTVIFAILSALADARTAYKGGKKKEAVKQILFSLFVFIIIGGIASSILLAGFPAIKSAHFRTNILTGNCNYGGYGNMSRPDPWYQKQGCDISAAEKGKLLRESDLAPKLYSACQNKCKGDLVACNEAVYFPGRDFVCSDLTK
jgi:hypothetical protein